MSQIWTLKKNNKKATSILKKSTKYENLLIRKIKQINKKQKRSTLAEMTYNLQRPSQFMQT